MSSTAATYRRPAPPAADASELRPFRAVVYLRVSTDRQVNKAVDPEGYSLPAQRQACYRKAESMEAEVVDDYVDHGESARLADRPAFQAMVQRIRTQRDVDYV